jgi:hypothetical protein
LVGGMVLIHLMSYIHILLYLTTGIKKELLQVLDLHQGIDMHRP